VIVRVSVGNPSNNMDKTELVNLVSSKAGISQDQAAQAVDTVLDFIKQKLPPELASQFDALLSGQASGGLRGILGAVQGLFGKKEQ
jgi:uncharacterized protein (DUF2267 family)